MSLLFCWYVPIAKSLRVEHERWCFRNLLLACKETCSAPCHRVIFDQIHPPVFLLRPESHALLIQGPGTQGSTFVTMVGKWTCESLKEDRRDYGLPRWS